MSNARLSALMAEYPWTIDALAILSILQTDEEQLGNGYFYLPTSEQNLLDNLSDKSITIGQLREWEQVAGGLVSVREVNPTYRTAYNSYSHPPYNAEYDCRQSPDRHVRCLRLSDSALSSEVNLRASSIVTSLDAALPVPSLDTVLDLLGLHQFLTSPVVRCRSFPLVSIHIGYDNSWPIDHLLVPDDLSRFSRRDAVRKAADGILKNSGAGLFRVKAHEFNTSSCRAYVGGIIVHSDAYDRFAASARKTEIERTLSVQARRARSAWADRVAEIGILSKFRDAFERGKPPLTLAEIEQTSAYHNLLNRGVIKRLLSGAVILAGDYADKAVLDRWLWESEQRLNAAAEEWLRSVLPADSVGPEPPPLPPRFSPPSSPTIVLGARSPDHKWGLLGKAGDKTVLLDITSEYVKELNDERAQAISVFGRPGSGKSYTLGVILEMALIPEPPTMASFEPPMASILFHYDKNQNYAPECLGLLAKNSSPDEISHLYSAYGLEPRAVQRVVMLVPQTCMSDGRPECQQLEIRPLVFDPGELTLDDWLLLMGVPGSHALYVSQMKALFQGLRKNTPITADKIADAILNSDLGKNQKDLAKKRLDLARRFLKDGASIKQYVKRGQLTILDLRDPLLDKTEAMQLCLVSLRQFQNVRDDHGQVPKLIVLDEAHKYMETEFAEEMETVIRQMRHHATSVVIASQDPISIPSKVVGLSSTVILHQMNSRDWVSHLKSGCVGIANLRVEDIATLEKGEAFIWTSESNDDTARSHAIRVSIRPRLTQHKFSGVFPSS